MKTPTLLSEDDCRGCGACVATCPRGAVSWGPAEFGATVPVVDAERCVGCGRCEAVCVATPRVATETKKAFIVVNRDVELLKSSASGGAFSAFAKRVLADGGVVFGTAASFDGPTPRVRCEAAESLDELPKLLGSKYVQSDCVDAFSRVKERLEEGRTVLFGGTSCQVQGLRAYLKNVDSTGLFTVDLICHGVPGENLFVEYVEYLEKKQGGKVVDFTFRTKRNRKIEYVETAKIKTASGRLKTTKRSIGASAYYSMFMGMESYRKACYRCRYASINKPADATVGDYFEARNDYPELFQGADPINADWGISCAILHNAKGRRLFELAGDLLDSTEIDLDRVVRSHLQLRLPPAFLWRDRLIAVYKKRGFAGIEKFYRRKRFFNWKEHISRLIGRKTVRKLKGGLLRFFGTRRVR